MTAQFSCDGRIGFVVSHPTPSVYRLFELLKELLRSRKFNTESVVKSQYIINRVVNRHFFSRNGNGAHALNMVGNILGMWNMKSILFVFIKYDEKFHF